MKGTVLIENDRGLSISRRYNGRKDRESILDKLIKQYHLTDYTLTITPDDTKDGQNIEHHGSGTVHRAYCSPCVVF